MIVNLGLIIVTVTTWALNKAIPALHADHRADKLLQAQQASNLCEQHGDCEAQKVQALQGMKPVVRLDSKPSVEVPAK